MRAIVREGGRVVLASRSAPARPAGWARVRVLLAGICRTDLYVADGRLGVAEPRVLGHEMVGEVVEADEGGAVAVGERVTASPLVPCATCQACARRERCEAPLMLGVSLDGAFADELVVPAASLHPVPRDLPLRRAAFVEPLAASLAVLGAPIHPSQRGAVLGGGRIGAVTARILRARGFTRVEELTLEDAAGGGLDFVVETLASADVLARAFALVRPGGVVVLKSRPPAPVPIDVAAAVRKDLTLAAVSYGPFAEAVGLARELPLDDLLGDVFALDRFEAALARARADGGGAKVFLSTDRGA